MRKILVYTFRTFPHTDKLKSIFNNVSVFGELKIDIKQFTSKILKEKPDLILGIALSKGISVFEPKTVNKFNSGKIKKDGKDELQLFVPMAFKTSSKPSSSFCNYSMYKIRSFLEENNLNIPFGFAHINENEISCLKRLT
jgi:hypothetical protein